MEKRIRELINLCLVLRTLQELRKLTLGDNDVSRINQDHQNPALPGRTR